MIIYENVVFTVESGNYSESSFFRLAQKKKLSRGVFAGGCIKLQRERYMTRDSDRNIDIS
jgi:hypothetical protein